MILVVTVTAYLGGALIQPRSQPKIGSKGKKSSYIIVDKL